MTVAYPNNEGFAFDFARANIRLGARVFTAISSIKHKQPIEEGEVRGSSAVTLSRTRGAQKIGDGSIEWSDIEEAQLFIDQLGDGWQEKIFLTTIVYVAPNKPAITHKLFGCRLLDNEIDHSEGADSLPVTMPFSFMSRTLNGKRALII